MDLHANAKVTWRAAAMAGVSNLLAQSFTLYKGHKKFLWQDTHTFNYTNFFYFVLWAVISTPPNYEWQMWLERTFPGTVTVSKHKISEINTQKLKNELDNVSYQAGKIRKRNILAKFLADQIVGGTVNTLAFLAFFAYIDKRDVMTALKTEFWPMRVASLRLWPAVALLNYTVIPAQHRVNFANLVGIGWGIYLSLLSL